MDGSFIKAYSFSSMLLSIFLMNNFENGKLFFIIDIKNMLASFLLLLDYIFLLTFLVNDWRYHIPFNHLLSDATTVEAILNKGCW